VFETELKHIDGMNTNFKVIYSILSFFFVNTGCSNLIAAYHQHWRQNLIT
jgi:hypothetical protein